MSSWARWLQKNISSKQPPSLQQLSTGYVQGVQRQGLVQQFLDDCSVHLCSPTYWTEESNFFIQINIFLTFYQGWKKL